MPNVSYNMSPVLNAMLTLYEQKKREEEQARQYQHQMAMLAREDELYRKRQEESDLRQNKFALERMSVERGYNEMDAARKFDQQYMDNLSATQTIRQQYPDLGIGPGTVLNPQQQEIALGRAGEMRQDARYQNEQTIANQKEVDDLNANNATWRAIADARKMVIPPNVTDVETYVREQTDAQLMPEEIAAEREIMAKITRAIQSASDPAAALEKYMASDEHKGDMEYIGSAPHGFEIVGRIRTHYNTIRGIAQQRTKEMDSQRKSDKQGPGMAGMGPIDVLAQEILRRLAQNRVNLNPLNITPAEVYNALSAGPFPIIPKGY